MESITQGVTMELSELELTGRRQTPTEARFEDLQVLDVVSYSMAHNRISIVRSVTVTGGSTDLDGAVITIELRDDESRLSKPFTTTVDIAAGRETMISNPELLLDAAVMSQVAEQRPGELVFALSHQDREILTHTQPVQVLAARNGKVADHREPDCPPHRREETGSVRRGETRGTRRSPGSHGRHGIGKLRAGSP